MQMLRASDIHEDIITSFRVQQIETAAIIAAMDSSAEDLKITCKEASGIDTAKHGVPHKVNWANVHNAWMAARVNVEVKTKLDSVSRAHGRLGFLDQTSSRFIFGMCVHDAKLPSSAHTHVEWCEAQHTTPRVHWCTCLRSVFGFSERRGRRN